MEIPLTEVFWPPPWVPLRFIPSNFSWFWVSIFWKAYKFAIKLRLPWVTCTSCCQRSPENFFSLFEHCDPASYWNRSGGSEQKGLRGFYWKTRYFAGSLYCWGFCWLEADKTRSGSSLWVRRRGFYWGGSIRAWLIRFGWGGERPFFRKTF